MGPIQTYSVIKSIPGSIKIIKGFFDVAIIPQLQRLSIVKLTDGKIRKFQLSFELYNNKAHKIIDKIRLTFNDVLVLRPFQEFRHSSLGEVTSYKPFYPFILGEKAVKELNLEFDSEKEIRLEENNNFKLELASSDGEKHSLEFGVLLTQKTINEIESFDTRSKHVLFVLEHFEV